MELSRSAVAVHAAIGRWKRLVSLNRQSEADRVAEQIVATHMGLLTGLAGKYSTAEISREEMIQAGRVGLLSALERFDLNAGAKFLTFATTCVQGVMLRYLRDNAGGSIHQPVHSVEMRRKIKTAAALIEARGEEATAENLAVALDKPIEEIERALAADAWVARRPLRFGQAVAKGEIDPERDTQLAIDWSADADTRLALDYLMARLLTWEERTVLDLRYREQRSQVETAKLVERCQATVSRIEERALAKLRAHLSENPL